MMRRTWQQLLGALGLRNADREMSEELESHVHLMADEDIRRGVARDEAYRRARIKFGNLESMKERYRDQRGLPLIETVVGDVRHAARVLGKNPGFAAVAIASLALGIGANTAIFSVINAAFFAPYGIKEPEHLLRLWGQDLKRNILQLSFSVPKYQLSRHQQTSFESIGAAATLSQTLLLNGTEPVQVNGALATSSFLDTFGATPLAGRFFRAEEERGANVVVLGEGLWRRRFAADPSIVGRAITLDGAVERNR